MLPRCIKQLLRAVERAELPISARNGEFKRVLTHLLGHMDLASQRVLYGTNRKSLYLPTYAQIARRTGLNFWRLREYLRALRHIGWVELKPSRVTVINNRGRLEFSRGAFTLQFTPAFFSFLNFPQSVLGKAALFSSTVKKHIVNTKKKREQEKLSQAARVLRETVNEYVMTGQIKSSYEFIAAAADTRQIDLAVLKEAFPGAVERYLQNKSA